MDSMFSMIDIMIAACGAYVLYTWYLLRFKGEIKESMLLPRDVQAKKCKDKKGYIAEISPKLLVYGIVVTICGVLGILEGQYKFLGNWYYATIVFFLIVTGWFAMNSKKAVQKYWPK